MSGSPEIVSMHMRDDIHKSAPLASYWRAVMKNCQREADRKERAARAALRAITSDCNRELSPNFLANLVDQIRQHPLFGMEMKVKGDAHVLQKQVMGHLNRRCVCGEKGETAVKGALGDAIKERLDSSLYSMKGHWLKHGGKDANVPIEAATKAINNLPIGQIVEGLLSEEPKTKDSKEKIDLDEDLR